MGFHSKPKIKEEIKEERVEAPIELPELDDSTKINSSDTNNVPLKVENVEVKEPKANKEIAKTTGSEEGMDEETKENEPVSAAKKEEEQENESGQDLNERNQDTISEENEKDEDLGDDKSDSKGFASENPVHNAWSENKNNALIPDTQTEKPVLTEDFKARMKAIKELRPGPGEWLAGWPECDVEDCVVCLLKEEYFVNKGTGVDCQTDLNTRNGSPCASTRADTGTVSPAEYAFDDPDRKKVLPLTSENETGPVSDATTTKVESSNQNTSKDATMEQIQKRKVAKNLQKVRRALKTLGVNLYEMDDKTSEDRNNGGDISTCEKECCRLGCICESIASKPVAPTHCGKVECMFRCSCSEEALKNAAAAALSPTGNRRSVGMGARDGNGISAEGCAAKLTRSSSSSMNRRLAAEEQKFNHSVVAATGGTSTASFLMLGATTGRQRRERKVPTRYQDSDAFAAEWGSGVNITDSRGTNGGGALVGELDHDFDDFGCGVDGPGSAMGGGAKTRADDLGMKRMTIDNLRNDTIARCTVLLPMIKLPTDVDTRVWCMYHCQYRCPCSDYKNPLDYGPDLSKSRNVSKRTGSKVFITKKRKASVGNSLEVYDKDVSESKSSKQSPAKISVSGIGKPFDKYSNARKIKIRKVNGKYVSTCSLSKQKKSLFNEDNASSRTSGLVVRSNKSRMPHKIVLKKKKKKLRQGTSLTSQQNVKTIFDEGIVLEEHNQNSLDKEKRRLKMLANVPISRGEVIQVSEYSSTFVMKSEGKQEDDESNDMVKKLALKIQNDKLHSSRLNLNPKSKGETQFPFWGTIRHSLQKRHIKMWCFYRKAIPHLFLTMAREAPYEPSAFDVQIMVQENQEKGLPSDMPPMVRGLLLNTLNQEDLDKHAILIYSGRAWEITGQIEKRVSSNVIKDKVQNSLETSPKHEDSRDGYPKESDKVSSVGPIFENRGSIQPFRHHSKLTPPPPLRRKTSNINPTPPVAIVQPQPQHPSYTKSSLLGSNLHTPSTSQPAIPKIELPEQPYMMLEKSADSIDNDLSCTVNVESVVEKLPSGKNLVTMVRGIIDNQLLGTTQPQQPTMQIKLPPTAPNQHWSIIRVDGNQGSVQCPDSTLALKVNVLKQAAELAMKEKTTVRIPIPVRTESETFGVYAVPGLQTHVFVGPFSTVLPQPENSLQSISNVDTASVTIASQNSANQELIQISDSEDDDIKEVAPTQGDVPSKSSPSLPGDKSNVAVVKEPNQDQANSEVISQRIGAITKVAEDDFKILKAKILQDKLQRKLAIRNAILAQVPQLIKPVPSNKESKEIDVIDISDDDDENDKTSQPNSQDNKSIKTLPYTNLEGSNYGKIVYQDKEQKGLMNLEGNKKEDAAEHKPKQSKMISIEIPGFGELKMEESIRNKSVLFPHPRFDNHDVLCPDSSSAVLWMNEYLQKQKTGSATQGSISSTVQPKNTKETATNNAKSLIHEGKSKFNTKRSESRVERMASFRVQNFNRKEHREEVKLFYELNKLIRRGQPRKATSIQILAQAKETVEQLTADQVDLEQTKKALLRKRVTLFESFVQTLNGFPIAVKKRALLDTKEMLKKIKEQRGKDKVGTEMLPPPSPLPSIPAIKIESVQSIKETNVTSDSAFDTTPDFDTAVGE